jgi:hypothetical protein
VNTKSTSSEAISLVGLGVCLIASLTLFVWLVAENTNLLS